MVTQQTVIDTVFKQVLADLHRRSIDESQRLPWTLYKITVLYALYKCLHFNTFGFYCLKYLQIL